MDNFRPYPRKRVRKKKSTLRLLTKSLCLFVHTLPGVFNQVWSANLRPIFFYALLYFRHPISDQFSAPDPKRGEYSKPMAQLPPIF